jgi:hypothetical protein
VSNAQWAEESYQLKRDNATLRKQIEELNHQRRELTSHHHRDDGHTSDDVLVSNQEELEDLRQSINRLTAVGYRIIRQTLFRILSRSSVDFF